jgi:hypothetical protein
MALTLRGVSGLTVADVNTQVAQGGRFVVFQFVVSLFVVSLRRNSPIYFVRAGESTLAKCLPWCGLSLIFGWWGIPWGILWTPFSILRNLRGGIDVTEKVVPAMNRRDPAGQISDTDQGWSEAEAFLASVKPM